MALSCCSQVQVGQLAQQQATRAAVKDSGPCLRKTTRQRIAKPWRRRSRWASAGVCFESLPWGFKTTLMHPCSSGSVRAGESDASHPIGTFDGEAPMAEQMSSPDVLISASLTGGIGSDTRVL
jgi:hypothetical protein